MSLFLNQIHYDLFYKIRIQDKLCNSLMELCIDENLKNEMKNQYPEIANLPLNEIIDLSNIHLSLMELINRVEKRLAFIVKFLLEKEIATREVIFKKTESFGKNYTMEGVTNPKEAFEYVKAHLVNGMPCDRIEFIEEEDDEKIIWSESKNIHSVFWKELNLDDSLFFNIRNNFIQAMMNHGFTFKVLDSNKFEIRIRKDSMSLLLFEHDNILSFIKIFRNKAIKLMNNKDEDVSEFHEFIDFVVNYGDAHHHGKEEKILFNYMIENLGSAGNKLIRSGMLVEHDIGRMYIRNLKEALEKFESSKEDNHRIDIIANAISYGDLLQRHIDKENNVVYTFAQRSLSQNILDKVEAETKLFEKEENASKIKYESWLRNKILSERKEHIK